MKTPRVTIIIPVYNAEPFLEECVKSALYQTWKNIEVIAVDNESTDDSWRLLNKLAREHPLIVDQAPNTWSHTWDEPRDKGFEWMTGEYFQILAADDHIDQRFIERNMRVLLADPGRIKATQSYIWGINEEGHYISSSGAGYQYSSLEEFKEKLLGRCVVNTPTVVWHSSFYHEGLMTSTPEELEEYGGAVDYNLYCRLADQGHFIWPVPRWFGYNYRWHDNQATWAMQRNFSGVDAKIRAVWREKWGRSGSRL